MGHTARQDRHARPHAEQKRLDVAGFKPLALPALAAAVHMSRRTQRRPAGERDLPAILHEDAVVG